MGASKAAPCSVGEDPRDLALALPLQEAFIYQGVDKTRHRGGRQLKGCAEILLADAGFFVDQHHQEGVRRGEAGGSESLLRQAGDGAREGVGGEVETVVEDMLAVAHEDLSCLHIQ